MKSKILTAIAVTFFLSHGLMAQSEYDESFLKSLPEEIRKDLLAQKDSRDEGEQAQYRRPSTFIDKPSEEDKEKSERFGMEIFSMMQTTLMPINEPNFDGSYVLDFGDVLEIQLVGQESLIERMPVNRDGSISIPNIGKIYVSGLSLSEASNNIKNKVSASYIGVNAYISLVNVRDIQIIVAGDVFSPGPYTLNGNSNLFHALSVAGGPSEIGSFRNIKLVRQGKTINVIDLYDTFIYGKSNFGPRLRSGDLIFVGHIENLVRISGGVRRPSTYELKSDEPLSKAINFANGITNQADLSNIKLFRISGESVAALDIKELNELDKMTANDNDKIVIRKFPFREVKIIGAVTNPGTYIMNEGDGILDLVTQAGGYTDTAYPFGGVLENENTRKINEMATSELYSAFLNALSTNYSGAAESSLNGVIEIMQELKNSPVSGRVSAEFDIKKLRADASLDIKLQDGDQITIPEVLDHLYVYGEVPSQGTVRFLPDRDAKYYIDLKGGFGSNANVRGVFILQPNGETIKMNPSRNLFMSDAKNNIQVFPGSVIFVPRKTTNAFAATQTAQAYATILGNIGVSLASISVLKD